MVLKPWLGMSSATISVGWVDAIAPMPKDISEKGEKNPISGSVAEIEMV